MDEITKGMEALVKMSKDMLDLSEEIKRDLQKIVGQDELERQDIHLGQEQQAEEQSKSEDSGQMEKERDDFHAGQEEQQRNNTYENE